MDVSGGGKFSHTIMADQLSKGLRHSKRDPRNRGFLTTCQGAVGRDNVLQVLDELNRFDTEVVEVFPFPQIFVFTNHIIVCGQIKIYEWIDGGLVEMLTVVAGDLWNALDFYNYVYMSNGKVSVVRDSRSQTYSITTELPTAMAMCNFNGQVLVGAPDVIITSQGTIMTGDPVELTMTQHGGWS